MNSRYRESSYEYNVKLLSMYTIDKAFILCNAREKPALIEFYDSRDSRDCLLDRSVFVAFI